MANSKTHITDSVKLGVEKLRDGGVVGIPTETVYGLGADATNDEAVALIYTYKKRPKFNPLIVHVLDLEQASHYIEVNEKAKELARAFWPGPLTLVLPLKVSSEISLLCSAGLETLAVRSPSHPVAREILEALAKPLAAPSANPSSTLSPTSAEHVFKGFEDQDLTIIDGGTCQVGLESTILDLSTQTPTILRYGAITRGQIEEILGETIEDHTNPEVIKSPGQMLKHYAPTKLLRMDAADSFPDEGYLGFGPHNSGENTLNLSPSGDLREAASNLFKMLHEMDASDQISGIAVAPIPDDGLGVAINDRLKRAAGKG